MPTVATYNCRSIFLKLGAKYEPEYSRTVYFIDRVRVSDKVQETFMNSLDIRGGR